MFDNWKEQREAIKKHILKIYDGTNSKNRDELNRFLEFVIGNYSLDDAIFEQVEEDLEVNTKQECQDIVSLEDEEYRFNILNRRCIW